MTENNDPLRILEPGFSGDSADVKARELIDAWRDEWHLEPEPEMKELRMPRPTKANLECADVILRRNQLSPHTWTELRRDIALTIDTAEREAVKKYKASTKKKGNRDDGLGAR